MSVNVITLNDRLQKLAENQAVDRGSADATASLRSLLENAIEVAELNRLLQEGEDSIVAGESLAWAPGDGVRMYQEILERRKREGKACPSQ